MAEGKHEIVKANMGPTSERVIKKENKKQGWHNFSLKCIFLRIKICSNKYFSMLTSLLTGYLKGSKFKMEGL